MTRFNTKSNASTAEQDRRMAFLQIIRESPIPDAEILENLPLFLNRQTLTNVLFMDEVYRQILDAPGSIFEFGVRWGKNLALYENLRGIYEPFNYTRKIVGFDTFEGFPSVSAADGDAAVIAPGAYSVTEGYESYLAQVLAYHESESPIGHLPRSRLIKGDVKQTLPSYLKERQETVIALAYFDFDLYAPTLSALREIKPYLAKGAVLAFDQLNYETFPGETMAIRDALPTPLRLRRSRFSIHQSYAVWGE